MNEPTTYATSLDAIALAYQEGANAMPSEVGDGYSIVTTPDGGIQLAIYWDDHLPNGTTVRRTLLVQGGMLRFFDELSDALHKCVKAARRRKVVQVMGELSRERDRSQS